MKKKAILNNDDALFIESVYKEYCPLMFSVSGRFGLKKSDQEDVISNAMISLMNNAATLKNIASDARRYYIAKAVLSATMNHLKKQGATLKTADKSLSPESEPDFSSVTEEKAMLRIELANVLSSIMSLPEKESQCIRLKYLSDCNNSEIARITGLSENSVNQYILRARKHIRSLLYGNGDGEQNG